MSPSLFEAEPYKGELSPAMAADLHNAALKAGHDLLLSARMLMERYRYGHASALAILAIEEFGKTAIVMEILLSSLTELLQAWKRYRAHEAKSGLQNIAVLMAIRTNFPEITMDDAKDIADKGPTPRQLNIYKQGVIYSDCYISKQGDIRVHKSSDLNNQDRAASLIAEALVSARQLRERSSLEMNLFKKHAQLARHAGLPFSSCLHELEKDLVNARIIQPGDWKSILSDVAT